MFKYSKVALGLAACFALSGCLEVEDNNNDDALVAQLEKQNQTLEQQNQILQNQLDHNINRSEAWKTAITLSGAVQLATDGDALADDVTVTFYYNGKWHDAVSLNEDNTFEVSDLPAQTHFIAKVSSASGAVVTRNFIFQTDYANDKMVQNLNTFEVGQPEKLEFTVLDANTNQPFADLKLEGNLNGYVTSWNSALKDLVDDNVAQATLNAETGKYELVVPKGININLEQDRDLDNDGTDDVEYFNITESNQLKSNQLLYISKVQAEEYKIAVTFISSDGQIVKPEHVFATNNDFGASDFAYDEETNTFSIDANYYGQLRLLVPSFIFNEVQYDSRVVVIDEYNQYNDSYYVKGASSVWNNREIAIQDNQLSLVVKLEEKAEQNLSIEVVTDSQVLTTDQAMTYYFNTPVALSEESVVTIEQQNSLEVTAGNVSDSDSIDPGYTQFVRKDLEIASAKSLSFNDTALTIKPDSVLEEGYDYIYRVKSLVNKKSQELNTINYERSFNIAHTGEFSEDAFLADNFNFRKAGQLITAKNTAGVDAGNNSSNTGRACILVHNKYNVSFNMIKLQKAIVNGIETQFNDSWSWGGGTESLYQLADNENILNNSWYVINAGSAQENGLYKKQCIEIQDSNWNTVYFEDNTDGNENSITVEIEYGIEIDGYWETKTTEKKLYID